ncbi:phage holin family protein [Roseomonas sp. BN140053]|uniref:phage holin family protein n=1 Tax=Roseomonas sp. BN140053 TaxID=3391898 RepID=UPI0039E8BBBE
MGFLARTVITAIAFWVAAHLVSGIELPGVIGTLFAAIIFGLVNAVIRPVLSLLSLPLTILTLGLFTLVINAAMFGLTAALSPGMRVHGFGAAILGAIVVWLVSWAASRLIGDRGSALAGR